MPDFAILSEKGGIAEDIPTVLISEVFVAKGSQNVRERYGRWDKMKGRLADLTDSEGVKVKTPTDVFVITSIVTGTKTINITGDHSAGATALSVGDTFRVNGGTEAANNLTFTVDTLPTTSSIVTVEDLTAEGAIPGNVFVGATPVIKYHRHVEQDSGTERLLLGTKYHIFLWSHTSRILAVKWTNLNPSEVKRWEIKDHLRNVVATNNSDFVLWWDVDSSAGNDFEALDNANGIDYEGTGNRLTKCKYLTSYETFLILGFTTEGGTAFPQRERWAGRGTGGDDIDFDENGDSDAGAKDFTTTPGFLMGFARHGDDLVISKEDSMHRSWLVTADTVFEWQEYTLKIGNISADGLINDKAGRLYWIASDLTIREINTPQSISTTVDVTVRGLNTAAAEFIQATWIDEFKEIWWAIPSGDSETNDVSVSFKPEGGRSFVHDIPIRAFGDFTQQESFTYNTLPYANYNDWGSAWNGIYNSQVNIVGFPLDLASDYEGNTFDLHQGVTDDGEPFIGTIIVSTGLTGQQSMNIKKQINNGAYLIFNRKSSGEATLYVKRDTESSWQLLGTASFTNTDPSENVIVHVPFNIMARNFQFKIESSDEMEFIGIYFVNFSFVGER